MIGKTGIIEVEIYKVPRFKNVFGDCAIPGFIPGDEGGLAKAEKKERGEDSNGE